MVYFFKGWLSISSLAAMIEEEIRESDCFKSEIYKKLII